MLKREVLPIEQLVIDPVQSRDQAWVGDETDRQLADSINTEGLLQDLIVRPLDASAETVEQAQNTVADESTYAIVAGSRRYHAAMEAGHETVPCKIVDAGDLDAAWKSLTENVKRRELSEQEIANQLQLIYQHVCPQTPPEACPDCGEPTDGEAALLRHCEETTCELPGSVESGPPTASDTLAAPEDVEPNVGRF